MALHNLPSHSRIWIFQSASPLSNEEQQHIHQELKRFLTEWNTHGSAMHADFEFHHDQVLVVAADEARMAASGCSIDKLTREVQRLGAAVNKNLLDRQTIFYQENGSIQSAPIATFWGLRKANRITDETLVLDTTVKNLSEWQAGGWKKFGLSWHKEMYGR